jgi:nucleotide-binding universal stress UspA family protein
MAKQLKASAVIMTAHKHSALAELLIGSITTYVAHHCDQPVIVLHARG